MKNLILRPYGGNGTFVQRILEKFFTRASALEEIYTPVNVFDSII